MNLTSIRELFFGIYIRAKTRRVAIHVSDNAIVGHDTTSSRATILQIQMRRHCLDRGIDFGNLQLRGYLLSPSPSLCLSHLPSSRSSSPSPPLNMMRLLTSRNGPFRTYLQWNHPRRAFSSFIESFTMIRAVNGEAWKVEDDGRSIVVVADAAD